MFTHIGARPLDAIRYLCMSVIRRLFASGFWCSVLPFLYLPPICTAVMPKRKSGDDPPEVDDFDFEVQVGGSPKKKKRKPEDSRKPELQPVCPVPPCPHLVRIKKRFCEHHQPTWDNMVYQAKTTKLKNDDGTLQKDKDGKDKTKLEQFNRDMRDDRVAGMAVEKHEKNNPPGKKYKRYSFIDWAVWEREFGQRAEVGEEDRATPMTKRVFECWAKTEQGEDEQGTEEWWQELLDDANIDRDNKGRRNELQLYVPKKAERFRKKYKFEGSTAREGNKVAKDATEEDIQEYRDQVLRQGNSFSSDWLRTKEPSGSSTDKKDDSKEKAADLEKVASQPSPAKPVKLRKGEITAVRALVFEDVNM